MPVSENAFIALGLPAGYKKSLWTALTCHKIVLLLLAALKLVLERSEGAENAAAGIMGRNAVALEN